MHGAVHDYVVLKTVKGGEGLPSAETIDGGAVRDYISYKYSPLDHQPVFRNVLEIGSLDINGSQRTYNFINRGPTWLSLVGSPEYIGLDLIPGPSVDVVSNAHSIPYQDNNFDLVLCMNMLEHDTDPQKTIEEACRVLKVGQPAILTTVNQNWEKHPQLGGGDTETFNEITKEQFTEWVLKADFINCEIIEWKDNLFCYAVKGFIQNKVTSKPKKKSRKK